MLFTNRKTVSTMLLCSLMIIPLITLLPYSFSQNTFETKNASLNNKNDYASNLRHVQKYSSVAPKPKTNYNDIRKKNLHSNIFVLVNGDNCNSELGYSFVVRSYFYDEKEQLHSFSNQIDQNTKKKISVASSKFLNLEVKINLPNQKWESVSLTNKLALLNFITVDPASVRFQIIAKGHKNNPTIDLLETYHNRNSSTEQYIKIGSYDVYNINKSATDWLFKNTFGQLLVSLLATVILFVISFAFTLVIKGLYSRIMTKSGEITASAVQELAKESSGLATNISINGDLNPYSEIVGDGSDVAVTTDEGIEIGSDGENDSDSESSVELSDVTNINFDFKSSRNSTSSHYNALNVIDDNVDLKTVVDSETAPNPANSLASSGSVSLSSYAQEGVSDFNPSISTTPPVNLYPTLIQHPPFDETTDFRYPSARSVDFDRSYTQSHNVFSQFVSQLSDLFDQI